MGRWARSMALVRASWAVIRQDSELLVLPLLSGITSLALSAALYIPLIVTSMHTGVDGEPTVHLTPFHWIGMILASIVLVYTTLFFKTALLCGAAERMDGGNPTVASALAGAARNAGRIVPWAVLSATVSMVLRAAEERAGIIGRIAIGLVGLAWSVVTFLVLPVLVFEQVSVGVALKRSAAMLRHTWGENLIVNTGIGLVSFVLCLPAFIGIAAGAATQTALGLGTMIVIGVLWIIGVACWSSAMSGVFQVALYRYARDGVAPAGFAHIDFREAFRTRTSRQKAFGF